VRLLLDECVPRHLRRELSDHEVRTVPEMGWAAKENGELLELAVEFFDAFITVDQRLHYQQDVSRFSIAVIVLVVRRNKIEFLLPLMDELRQLLPNVQPRQSVSAWCLTLGLRRTRRTVPLTRNVGHLRAPYERSIPL
jgi:hypothetical protein